MSTLRATPDDDGLPQCNGLYEVPQSDRFIEQMYFLRRKGGTHQGIARQTPLPPASPPTRGTLTTPLEAESVLGGLYHTYRRAA